MKKLLIFIMLVFGVLIGCTVNVPKFAQQTKSSELQLKNQKVLLAFAQPMDKKSVESNFKIYPKTKYSLAWKDEKNLEISLQEVDKTPQEYTINVLSSAKQKDGKILANNIVKTFKTTGIAMIDFVSPVGEITNLNQYITVRFSKPIVSLTNLDNQKKCPIIISPEIPGKCVRITTSTFQFRPEKGFPIGGKYSIKIPSGIDTIAGDKTTNTKEFEISTPKFQIISLPSSLDKDQKLFLVFNSEVDLNVFKQNFQISGISKEDLNIEFFKTSNGKTRDDTITIFPKSGSWGYGSAYTYKILSNMKSLRGNVPLGYDSSTSLQIRNILVSYKPFVYVDKSFSPIELETNFRYASDSSIVPKDETNILLNFYEEMPLDYSLFKVNAKYSLKYKKVLDCKKGDCTKIDDKKSIILQINEKVQDKLSVQIQVSKIKKANDIKLEFNTKDNNKILSYQFVDYYTSCIESQNEIGNANIKKINFGSGGKAIYISKIWEYDTYSKCKFKKGVNTYALNTKLDPDQDITVSISKGLLDDNNIPLDKDYIYQIHTNKALNEDKYVSLVDNSDNILVPEYVSPLGVAVKTINLDKINIKVCEGNFDATAIDYIKDSKCESKDVSINNLGFKTNFSVINLNKIFGKDFSKSIVTLQISKLTKDQTEYEKNGADYYGNGKNIITYIRTNKSVVLKMADNQKILWLMDFKTGKPIENQISKIKNYSIVSKTDMMGRYLGTIGSYVGNIDFEYKKDGIYLLKGEPKNKLVLVLKSGEEILVDGTYFYQNQSQNISYLKTERPLYKPGDKVYLKGIFRVQKIDGYEIKKGNIKVSIKDPMYKEIFSKTINLSNIGSLDMDFQLAKDASLGNYTINTDFGSTNFEVQEYEKPDFKVDTKAEKTFYVYGDKAKLDVSSDYYIGVPLANGQGTYSIMARNYNFDGGKTKGYIWGEYRDWRWFDDYYDRGYDSFVENGTFSLDEKGKKSVYIDLANKSSEQAKDKTYNISTTITDPSTKKSISNTTSFNVLRSPVLVGMKLDKYYYDLGDTVKFDFITVDSSGNPVANQNIKFKTIKFEYNRREYRNYEETEKTLLSKDLTTDKNGKVHFEYKIQDEGKLKFEISVNGGKYTTTKTMYVSGKNLLMPKDKEHSLTIIPSAEIFNVGENAEFIIQSPIVGVKALISIEKLNGLMDYEVIDIKDYSQIYKLNIKKEYLPNIYLNVFLIKNVSDIDGLISKLKNVRTKMVELEKKIYSSIPNYPMYIIYDILPRYYIFCPYQKPVKIDKTILTSLYDLREQENQIMQELLPDYFMGNINVKISTNIVSLKSNISIDKVSYLPGDKVQIELSFKDSGGKAVDGEATLAIVDKALLALKGENQTNILESFYSEKSSYLSFVYNMSNLIKRLEFSEEIDSDDEYQSRGYDMKKSMTYADGMVGAVAQKSELGDSAMYEMNAAPTAAMDKAGGASANTNATKLRTDFKDLAFYKGTISVKNGKAKIIVPKLPDDLTTWALKGFIFTSDTKVGSFDKEFATKKPVSLINSIPRFFVAGDKTQITSLVINDTDKDISATVSINMTNVSIQNPSQKISVKAKSQSKVVWDLQVDGMKDGINWNNYNTKINISVSAGKYMDSVELYKNIIPYSTPEYTFTNGSTEDLSYEEKIQLPDYIDKTQGKLDITLGSNILTNLTDSIDNIAQMPYWSSYSIMNTLYKGAVLKKMYSSIGESDKFEKIEVVDYNGNNIKLSKLMQELLPKLYKFQQYDGGFSYTLDCYPNYWRNTCSDRYVTSNFLEVANVLKQSGYEIDQGVLAKSLTYYKDVLQKDIEESEKLGNKYRDIDAFVGLSYHDKDFVKKYVLSDRFDPNYEFSNVDKLKIVLVLQQIDPKSSNIGKFVSKLKNEILIEARGSLMPANNRYGSNSYSTALALKVFINEAETEKLLIENFARWLIANKNQDGSFGSYYDTAIIIDAITDYINYTGEFKNIDFVGNAYLNNDQVMSQKFDSKNKFNNYTKSFDFQKYIKIGSGYQNSLGFEKTGKGKLYYDVGLRYFLPIEKIEPRDEGIIVSRNYYKYDDYQKAYKSNCSYDDYPIYFYKPYGNCYKQQKSNLSIQKGGNQGDLLVGEIIIVVPHERNNVIVDDFIPSGAEILNSSFDTTSNEVKDITGQGSNGWYWGGFDHIEAKTDRVVLYANKLMAGEYRYTYVIKLNHKGTYHHRPAVAWEMKKPEIWGRTGGEWFDIK